MDETWTIFEQLIYLSHIQLPKLLILVYSGVLHMHHNRLKFE
jgi:hypothetical protein